MDILNGFLTNHIVHAEPGTDKEMYANDVAEWILKRSADGFVVVRPKL